MLQNSVINVKNVPKTLVQILRHQSAATTDTNQRPKNSQILRDFLNTRHLRFQNGEKAPRLFSDKEFDRRLSKLRFRFSF